VGNLELRSRLAIFKRPIQNFRKKLQWVAYRGQKEQKPEKLLVGGKGMS